MTSAGNTPLLISNKEPNVNIPNHTRITLPRSLVPPRNATLEATSRSSLTLAVLRAHEQNIPLVTAIAADISAYRAYFHKIPGVVS